MLDDSRTDSRILLLLHTPWFINSGVRLREWLSSMDPMDRAIFNTVTNYIKIKIL